MKTICDIYKSSKISDMYLYVVKQDGLTRVPEPLMEKFGKAVHAMTLVLTPERELANADIDKVLASMTENGYYLQMPQEKEEYMQEVNKANSKLNKL
ncbi:YcgL domain-containing protein [Sessilibacter corallicola]|uniref:YcgL domain-containing protein NBRC116591_03670 n=1 Tax=Sessilibacter corallicola TaxID=2904075 RepID=A0ABQ0A4J2_9GAMM|nr:YcgL domain-containing protein [Sessilibacter corallicola]MCE2026828.1 YcgL domain-containing protein [Sessilibacter corallicola]